MRDKHAKCLSAFAAVMACRDDDTVVCVSEDGREMV